jgi:endonuclease YncB( thermonuclease family)
MPTTKRKTTPTGFKRSVEGGISWSLNSNDCYGRNIGVVMLSNKVILNEALLKNGYAWHYTEYDSSAIWSEFEASAKLTN